MRFPTIISKSMQYDEIFVTNEFISHITILPHQSMSGPHDI